MSVQVGILYENKKHLPTTRAINLALRTFLTAGHTKHLTPRECHLNPTEVNGLTTIHGMVVIANADIIRGRIRICAATPKAKQ